MEGLTLDRCGLWIVRGEGREDDGKKTMDAGTVVRLTYYIIIV